MKKALILLTALLCLDATRAQEPLADTIQPHAQTSTPEYAYCEIIGNHLPSVNGDGVLFDFGQPTKTWANNWLQDSKGKKIRFNSNIEALNYMTRQGWKFVQAYVSGEKSQNTHLLLRIPISELTEAQRLQLLAESRIKSGDEK